MIELDTAHMAPEITALLMLRGMGLPVIQWTGFANHTAKTKLDELDDIQLFKPHEIKNDNMAAAVRALIALYHGLTDETVMFACTAPEKERIYINALAQRHEGNPAESKNCLQQLQGHPIFEPLASYTTSIIGLGIDQAIKRLGDLIAMDEKWEPFAFADVYEQARDEQFSQANEEIVRKIQFQEYCLLMQYCYLAATGLDIGKTAKKTEVDPAELAKRRRQADAARRQSQRNHHQAANQSVEPPVKAQPPAEKGPSDTFAVMCPKCRKSHQVNENARGESFKCNKCHSSFKIPGGRTEKSEKNSEGGSNVILTQCPKCKTKLKFATNARGKQVMCIRCRHVFLLYDTDSHAA